MTADDARTDLAQLIGGTLRAEGVLYAVPSICYAVADAILARPGLLRALLDSTRTPISPEEFAAAMQEAGFMEPPTTPPAA